MILVVGHRKDPHVAAVLASLERLGRPFVVFDAFDASSGGVTKMISASAALTVGTAHVDLSEVRAVWWRQKPRFEVPTTAEGLYDYYFVHREWSQILEYIGIETSKAFSINDRRRASAADNKLTQLACAQALGFEVPRTLVSNDVDAINEFVRTSENKECIYKPFVPYMPPEGTITYASLVSSEYVLENSARLSVAPGIFQTFIPKKFELRITVVGQQLFTARIDSKHSARTKVDWRQDIFDDIYDRHDLPAEFARRILDLHAALGLFYAAYDFVITENDAPVFLEVNPAGQWLWLEDRLELPISDSIAVALASGP